MHTLAHLAKSKHAFTGGSERRSLARRLNRYLPKGRTIEWLEVGVGDGKNLLYLLDALGAGRRFNVTAIDPSPLAAKQLSSTYPINVLQQRLEDFQQLGDYDCINARQSAYYFEDPQASILKLAVQLTMEGVLAVTLWSQECVLYRLNRAIAHAADSGIEGLQADRLLASLPADQFLVERHREQCGGLDFGMLRRDGSAFAAMVALAARTIDIGGLSESRLADLFATLESELMSGERSNELLFIRKRSNLPTSKQGR